MSDTEYVWVETRPGHKVLVRKDEYVKVEDTTVRRGSESARFDEETRHSLSIQTGQVINNLADLNRYCEVNGSRVVERGDHVDRAIRSGRDCEARERVERRRREKGEAGGKFPLDILRRK